MSSHWSASLLGGGDWQEHRDVDGDGWADLAGYSRSVIRPRFFWDDKNGRTAMLTGGITYENRSGGTLPGATPPATGAPYTEALDTRRDAAMIIALGNPDRRRAVAAKIERAGITFVNAIHPSAVVTASARLGQGTMVGATAVINSNAAIGDHAIINTGAIVEHDTRVEEYAAVGPGAQLGGQVRLRV